MDDPKDDRPITNKDFTEYFRSKLPRDLYKDVLLAAYDYLERGTPSGREALISILEDVAQPLDSGVRKKLVGYFERIGTEGGAPREDVAYLIYASDAHALQGKIARHKIVGKVAQQHGVSKKVVRDAIKRNAERLAPYSSHLKK